MQTNHQLIIDDARQMSAVKDESIHLVVTSPPYPMIQMWDRLFCRLDPKVGNALHHNRGMEAFELMHTALDPVWRELYRVLHPGGIACINIGDAVRTVGNNFSLYPNHARILSYLLSIGFQALPLIIWRKPTNAPTKFMGSGMLPPGAYITLEHEYILILRKGSKRIFNKKTVKNRRQSTYFWEERNEWFSDVWMDLVGVNQNMAGKRVRQRSAAYPFELPFRLINMFSVLEDTVLDPFTGMGTTMMAAMVCGRNFFGYELEPSLLKEMMDNLPGVFSKGCERLSDRLQRHRDFVDRKTAAGHAFKHVNRFYRFPVMTRQETELIFQYPIELEPVSDRSLRVNYQDLE
jgi:DNA modification methylase